MTVNTCLESYFYWFQSRMNESSLILDRASEYYGFSAHQAIPLSGGHFSLIYEIPRQDDNFILRITPPNAEIDVSAMRAVLNWISYLAMHGASVPTPLYSSQGNLIETVELDRGLYVLVAYEKTSGTLAEDFFPDQWSDGMTSALGQAVGRMHVISRGYHLQDKKLLRPQWDEIINCFNPSDELDENPLLVAQKHKEIKLAIQTLPKGIDSYGLIHTDLHFANFLLNPSLQEVTIIDFDDCSYGWYIMDIAMLLLDMTVLYGVSECESYARNFLIRFMQSYLQHHSLDLYWISKLPIFLKLLEIGLYVMLYRQYDPKDLKSWVGRFMLGRRAYIENDIPYLDLDFSSLAEEIAQEI